MTKVTEARSTPRTPQIGIKQADLKAINAGLAQAVAETFTLYVKTQGYHWNVEGATFHSLHEMFEEQYLELRDAADLIAERMRALGAFAPGSFTEFQALATIKDHEKASDATDMVRILAEDHETVTRALRPLVDVADEAGDSATADLLTARLAAHEKHAWMLRATNAQ